MGCRSAMLPLRCSPVMQQMLGGGHLPVMTGHHTSRRKMCLRVCDRCGRAAPGQGAGGGGQFAYTAQREGIQEAYRRHTGSAQPAAAAAAALPIYVHLYSLLLLVLAPIPPPPLTNSLTHLHTRMLLLTQLLSVTETQYSGEDVVLVAPDSDTLSVLQVSALLLLCGALQARGAVCSALCRVWVCGECAVQTAGWLQGRSTQHMNDCTCTVVAAVSCLLSDTSCIYAFD